ncbi:TPA: hypothetical protein ACT5CK_001537 [Flavobacterium psychrophilum]|uniref:hypothetical protein n=2 Tax=Flavobacterium psychrophilum TaxID=96345 RepID=UPI00054C43AF|nr:hypothetical protein [Flavobacterium psychrophilum]OAE92520.1 hypothetical protein SU65_06400 [Flavobacterium psychrophilum]SNB94984.1 conserved membrane hypothetical protein [Flavobacterium psychrophilum]GEJ32186.1 hypothetical protein FPN181_contig00061-0031 [Flavobacterium psychrophilum]GEJ35209.1 hypothetical protein FPN185_contig00117-0031 [Flavobacterium psychrophilum]GEJ38407.1 hypothetical protein FPN187_contig00045-0031 [Flavobacterium psychrophilum]
MKNKTINIKAANEVNILILLFFGVTLTEVVAEFFCFVSFIYFLKALICPLLILICWKSSVKRNNCFILALIFGLIANIFFVAKDFNSILLGSLFFMFYRILIIYLVVKIVSMPNYLPVILATIPFAIIFLYVTTLAIDELGSGLYIYNAGSIY